MKRQRPSPATPVTVADLTAANGVANREHRYTGGRRER
jgi:hypothetical protein